MGKSESKDHVGFEKLESVQKDLNAYLHSDPSFDGKRTLKHLAEGIKALKEAVELASKEKEKLESKVKEQDVTISQRDTQIAQLEQDLALLREAVTSCQEQTKQVEQERDAALRSVAERDRQNQELQVRARTTKRFKGLATSYPDLGTLFQDIESSGEVFEDFQDPPPSFGEAKKAREEAVIQAIWKEVHDIEADGADRETLKQDLTQKGPLQALNDLVAQCQRHQESNSDIGKVVSTLGRDAQEILQKYAGDRPLRREDALMKERINFFIVGTIKELQAQRESSRTLQSTKDGEETVLVKEISQMTDQLNQIACRNKGDIEQERIAKENELSQYYVERVRSVMSEDLAAKLLEEKRTEFCFRASETRDEYERMRKTQDECIKDLHLRHEDLCALATRCDQAYKKEELSYKWVAMATRLLQRHHVSSVSESLVVLLETMVGLSNAGAIRDERRIACKEADSLCSAAKPRLLEAAEIHKNGRRRLVEATDVMELFEQCILVAFHGFADKVKQDRLDLERDQPMYGAKWLVVDQQLRLDIADVQETILRLHSGLSDEQARLVNHLNVLEYTDDEKELQKEVEELKGVETNLQKFEARFLWLQQTEALVKADEGNPAELVARNAPQSLVEEQRLWFSQYHPAPAHQNRRNFRSKAALEGRRGNTTSTQGLQIEDGQAITVATPVATPEGN